MEGAFDTSTQSVDYFLVCVPVVALGAPLGAVVVSYLDRRCFSRFVYFANITQIIGAFNIIKPWNAEMGLFLTVSSFVLIVVAAAVWAVVVHLGTMMMEEFEQKEGSDSESEEGVGSSRDMNTRGTDQCVDCGLDTVTTLNAGLSERQPLLNKIRMEL